MFHIYHIFLNFLVNYTADSLKISLGWRGIVYANKGEKGHGSIEKNLGEGVYG